MSANEQTRPDQDQGDERRDDGGLHPSAANLNVWSENAEGKGDRDEAAEGELRSGRAEADPTPENRHGAENAKDGTRGGGDGRSFENHASLRS